MASVIPIEGRGGWAIHHRQSVWVRAAPLVGRGAGHYCPGTSSLLRVRARGLWRPERTLRELQVLAVSNCLMGRLRNGECQVPSAVPGFLGCTPPPLPGRSLWSTTTIPLGTYQDRPAPGVPVLEGMWQASTQGPKSSCKGWCQEEGRGCCENTLDLRVWARERAGWSK